MTVDGAYTERWMTSGSFSMLTSSKVYIGGSQEFKLPGSTARNNNFVGCLRKVPICSNSIIDRQNLLAKVEINSGENDGITICPIYLVGGVHSGWNASCLAQDG